MNKHLIGGRKAPNNFKHCLKIMRITLFFLFFCILFSAASNSYSQEFTFDLKSASIREVCKQIEKKSDFIFVFSDNSEELIDKKVNVEARSKSITEILDAILSNSGLTYKILDKQIVVYESRGATPKTVEQTVAITMEQPAKRQITGKVVDAATGESVIGASVWIKNSTSGVVTDIDGNFSISVSGISTVLVISYLGYVNLEIEVGERRDLGVIKLSSSSETLEEVVIVGYGSQRKVSVTGAISNVSVKELEIASTPSLSTALGGKLPGVITRQSSGEPGFDQAAVHIRGIASWVSNSPLVLVDGVERDMNTINTQEIESLYILKDASATAVYGVRGANGVVIITTKKGIVGKPTITLRSEAAVLSPLRLPQYINGGEYARLVNEALTNKGENTRFSEEAIQKFQDGSDPYLYPNVNWVDEVLRKHTYQSIHNLNISGGSELLTYFVNAGFTFQDGLYKGDNQNPYNTNANLQRYNLRSRVDMNLSKSFSINVGLGGIIQQRNYPGNDSYWIFNAIKQTNPIAFPVRNPDGTPGSIAPDQTQGWNPWAVATQQGYRTQYYNTVQGTFGAKWDLSSLITSGLSLNSKFAYDHTSAGGPNRPKFFELKQYMGKDPETGEDIYVIHREEEPLGYSTYLNGNRSIYFESSLNYDKKFGIHSLTGMLLYNQRDYVNITAGTTTENLPYRHQGIAGRLTYDYDNRYLAEFNFGYNGSENFPKGKRFGFFPAASLGWIASNEKFWNVPFINHLKLRSSYGQSGNDQSGTRFLYLTFMRTTGNVNYSHFGKDMIVIPGIEEGQTGSMNVTWEVSTKFNIGADMGLFNDMVNLQFDIFKESRTGILIQRQDIPTMVGFYGTPPYGNLGEAENKGFDGQIEIKNKLPNGLFYSFRGNATFARNTIIENDEPIQKYSYQSQKGLAISQVSGLVALGFFKDQEDIDASPRQTFMSTIRPGDIKYQDINSDGVIDLYDRVPIGHPRTPEFMYGFGGTVAYKNIDISLFFSGAARTSFFLGGKTMSPFYYGETNLLREYYDNRWIPSREDNSKAKYPAIISEKNENNFVSGVTSTLWMRDGSYLRLKNAELGYTIPSGLSEKLNIKDIRVFVNGINLFTWDKIKIFDPESDSGDGGYPIQRNINVGFQINF